MAQNPSVQRVRSLDDVLRWLDALERAPAPRTTGVWPLAAVLDHLAQSVEMSMQGFPQSKGALFQQTAGAAAFAFFKWRGAMSHGPLRMPPSACAADGRSSAKSTAIRAPNGRMEGCTPTP